MLDSASDSPVIILFHSANGLACVPLVEMNIFWGQSNCQKIDLCSLERAEPRLLTQWAGRIAFELGYAGVFYHSRYGHSIEKWAIFEGWTTSEQIPIHLPNSQEVADGDPDSHEALRILGSLNGD